jgi:hyperosmotically inducible protein
MQQRIRLVSSPGRRLYMALASAVLTLASACSVMRGQESAGAYVDDATITTTIKSRYAGDSAVSAAAIQVETLQGEVQLSGFAKSEAEKERAEQIALATRGVTAVRNDIVVQP